MAEVKFRRIESSEDINNLPVVDGQIIYTKDGKQYIDYETDRVCFGNSLLSGSILWENEDTSQEFTTQDITLNSSNYDFIIWIFLDSTTTETIFNCLTIKGINAGLVMLPSLSIKRTITYNNDLSYNIGQCISGGSSVYPTRLIPKYAIGIKLGLFGD